MPKKSIQEAYERSAGVLLDNASEFGVAAARPSETARRKRYTDIFGRDASICALGMVASQDERLANIARTGLETLAKHQADNGQIPNSVNPLAGRRSFYYLGVIDASLWWLLALDFYHRYSGDKKLKPKLLKNARAALQWLKCQDQNQDGLLEEGEACNWSDDMPDNGRTLYSNALWCRVLDLYDEEKAAKLARDGLNTLFQPHRAKPSASLWLKTDPHHRQKELKIIQEFADEVPHYLQYVSYKYASERCDVYGNSLAVLFGIAGPARTAAIIRHLRNSKVSAVYPVQVLCPPVEDVDYDYRPYLEREDCANRPLSYHNGGVWPYAGGFYVMALKKAGKDDLAALELGRLAEALKVNNWEFREWFRAKDGSPQGMIGQSWNAGAFLLAYHYLRGEVVL